MLKKPVQSERTKQLKSEIKQMKAGPEYKPSKERLLRDQMKCFLARQDLVDQSYDKLFKVLAPESQGFTKTDLVEFMGYLQESAQLNKKTVEEHNIEKFTKECNIKDIKN
jgi:formate dehydrogenase assembly factor FdhD